MEGEKGNLKDGKEKEGNIKDGWRREILVMEGGGGCKGGAE